MKIKLKEKPEHIELIKAIGSSDSDKSKEALKIFANLVGPLVSRVLDETNLIDALYDSLSIGEYEPRTIPLDDFHDIDNPDHLRVSYSSNPGDLAYNMITGADDFPVQTFAISSAIAMYKKYLKAGRLNHAENGIRKLINEVRFKLKRQGIQPILDQLANAQSNGKYHIIRSETANQVVLKDFNRLQTLAARIISSGFGDTPESGVPRGITDLLMSPEIVEELRGIAYQPQNTRAGYTGGDEDTSVGIAAPEQVRNAVYNAGGIPSLYGTNIVQLNELGVGYDFNTLFDAFAGSNAYEGHAGVSTSTFDGATEELVIAMNRSFDPNGLIKVSIRDGENSQTFQVQPDDQFVSREGKVGYWGSSEQGYIAVEPRNLFGLIV